MASTGIILVYADDTAEPLVQPSLADYSLEKGDSLHVYDDGLAQRIEVAEGAAIQAHGGLSSDITILASGSSSAPNGLLKVYGGAVAEKVTAAGSILAFSGATISRALLTGGAGMNATGAGLSAISLQGSAKFDVIGGTLDGCEVGTGCKGILDGGVTVSGLTLHHGATIVVGSGVVFTGTVSIGAKLTQNDASTAASATADFLLTELASGGSALLDWSKCAFGNVTLTVSASQKGGAYALASSASAFNAPVTLKCASSEAMDTRIGLTTTYHNSCYALSLEDGALSVEVSDYVTAGSGSALSWGDINGATSYALELTCGTQAIALNLESENAELLGLANGDYTWRIRNSVESDNWQTGEAFTQSEAPEGPQELVATGEAPTALFFAKADGVWDSDFIARNTLTGETVQLEGKVKITDIFTGSEDSEGASILLLDAFASGTRQASGIAFFLDDIYSAAPSRVPGATATGQRFSDIDTIVASEGDDIIDLTSDRYALAGKMTILGGDGDDVIWAHAGDDVICGGAGNDTLHGGGGDDIFCFGEGWGQDTIGQLAGAQDKVTLWFSQSSETLQLSFATEGADTLIKAASGDSIRAVGMSLSIDDCRFGATGHEDKYSTLASTGAFA